MIQTKQGPTRKNIAPYYYVYYVLPSVTLISNYYYYYILTFFFLQHNRHAVILQIRSPTLQLKVCPENERGSGTAAGLMRGGTTPQQERSSATTPVIVTAAGSSVTPSQPVPVDPRLLERDRTLVCSDRWVNCHMWLRDEQLVCRAHPAVRKCFGQWRVSFFWLFFSTLYFVFVFAYTVHIPYSLVYV